jgi:HAD superfamily hydrolase (TIGR01509 family)
MGCSTDEAGGELERIMRMFDEFPRTVELIRELSGRGYGLYVLSNMPLEFYEHMRRTFDVFGYFDGVVISSLEKMAKPDPRFFGILTERYGLIPEETLFVDDKATNTGAAARLGFHVCEFDTETGPDEVRSMLGIE